MIRRCHSNIFAGVGFKVRAGVTGGPSCYYLFLKITHFCTIHIICVVTSLPPHKIG